MSVKIPEAVQTQLAGILRTMEETSELTRCVVVTRTGIKVAPDMDADSYSASSAALIDLGERVVASLEHGSLEELVINAIGGYVILAAVGKEFMLLGATSAAIKMGYYLPFLRAKAWQLENIIYGTKGTAAVAEGNGPRGKGLEAPEAPSKPSADSKAKGTGKITTADIKAADIRAMNDVLAAFDEFGINDDFTKALGDDAVPTVNISQEEMSVINQQKAEQAPIVQEIVPEVAPPSQAQKVASTAGSGSQVGGDCPIPLEPGEVPPVELSSEELVAEVAVAGSPAVTESSMTGEAPELLAENPAIVSAATAPTPEPQAAPPKISPPSFDVASEYDFDIDGNPPPEKDVVVPEQDSMSDTLKALGWEEEEDK